MKKTILLILALMPSLLLHSQEASDGNFLELTIIPRLESNYEFDSENGNSLTLGDSSIYSLFEGKYNNLSWTISTHFIHAGGDYSWPYTSLGYSNTTNFLEFCVANYTVGDLTFSLGKDMIRTGGIEYDDWDWNVHTVFASPLWQTLSCYQWGASASYEFIPNHSLDLQITTSPFGERPFSSKLFAFSAQYRGEFDWATLLWSASALGRANKQYDYLFCLGQRFNISDNLSLSLDWNNSFGTFIDRLVKGNTIKANATYSLLDKFEFGANFLYTKQANIYHLPDAYTVMGINVHYYPIDELRLHLLMAYNPSYHISSINIGLLYNLSLIK